MSNVAASLLQRHMLTAYAGWIRNPYSKLEWALLLRISPIGVYLGQMSGAAVGLGPKDGPVGVMVGHRDGDHGAEPRSDG